MLVKASVGDFFERDISSILTIVNRQQKVDTII